MAVQWSCLSDRSKLATNACLIAKGHEHALLRANRRSAAPSEATVYIGFFRSASMT